MRSVNNNGDTKPYYDHRNGDATADIDDQNSNDFDKFQQNPQQNMGNSTDEDETGYRGSKGWLTAIAKNMGKALAEKAGEMVEISHKIEVGKFDREGNTDYDQEQTNDPVNQEEQDELNAKWVQLYTSQFQAVSQEFGILNNAFTNALKTLGENTASMVKK